MNNQNQTKNHPPLAIRDVDGKLRKDIQVVAESLGLPTRGKSAVIRVLVKRALDEIKKNSATVGADRAVEK